MSAVIRHLNIAINGKPIVDDVDLDIADGERVGLGRLVRFRQIDDRPRHDGVCCRRPHR